MRLAQDISNAGLGGGRRRYRYGRKQYCGDRDLGHMHSLFTAPAEGEQLLETFVAVQQALADGAVPALSGSLGPAEEHPAQPTWQVRAPQPVEEAGAESEYQFNIL